MKKTWLGFVLVIIGSAVLGYVFSEIQFIVGLLGFMAYSMALVGMALLGEAGKRDE